MVWIFSAVPDTMNACESDPVATRCRPRIGQRAVVAVQAKAGATEELIVIDDNGRPRPRRAAIEARKLFHSAAVDLRVRAP